MGFFVEDMKNGEGKYLFCGGGEKKGKEKEEIIWKRKINGDADKRTNRPTGQIEQSVFEKYETEKLLVAS